MQPIKKTMLMLTSFVFCAFSLQANATSSHSVRGYARHNGTYVAPHRQTDPNHTQYDNWSSKGNINPYTGRRGYKAPKK